VERIFFSSEFEQENFANGLGFRVFKASNLLEPGQEVKFKEKTRKTKRLKGNS